MCIGKVGWGVFQRWKYGQDIPLSHLGIFPIFHSPLKICPNEQSFAPCKVVWKRMASDLEAVVLSKIKTPIGEKDVIPTDTTSLIPLWKTPQPTLPIHILIYIKLIPSSVHSSFRSYAPLLSFFVNPYISTFISSCLSLFRHMVTRRLGWRPSLILAIL